MLLCLAGTARAFPVPGTGERVRVDGYVDGLAVVPTQSSPRERPAGRVAVRADGTATRWLSGHIDIRFQAGGPFEGGHPGAFNLVHEFQNFSPSVEWHEAYLDLRLSRADVRAGIQTFAWGKLDGIPPTDVLNPRDFHDPLVRDFEEEKIGVPSLLGTYYLPDVPRARLTGLRASLVWVPLAVASRLPLSEERWFPNTSRPPAQVVVDNRPPLPPGRTVIPVRFSTRSESPPKDWSDAGLGFRLGGTWRESDWDLYYYRGAWTGPDAAFNSTVFLDTLTPIRVRNTTQLRQTFDKIQMAGGDWATTLGGATLRAEIAYFDDRPFLAVASDVVSQEAIDALPIDRIIQELLQNRRARVPLGALFPDLDCIEWGIGADYLIRGFVPLVQITQIAFLESTPELTVGDPETRLIGTLRKSWLGERLELELRGTYQIERSGWFFLPRLSYKIREDLRVRVGYLAIGGSRTSLFGQYKNNDEVVFQARYTF